MKLLQGEKRPEYGHYATKEKVEVFQFDGFSETQ
jgi:hypothetical protein